MPAGTATYIHDSNTGPKVARAGLSLYGLYPVTLNLKALTILVSAPEHFDANIDGY